MTQKEMIEQLATEAQLTKSKAGAVLATFVKNVQAALVCDGRLNVSGLGVFTVKARAARKGLNPQTGEEIDIPASKTVKFKPARELKKAIN